MTLEDEMLFKLYGIKGYDTDKKEEETQEE